MGKKGGKRKRSGSSGNNHHGVVATKTTTSTQQPDNTSTTTMPTKQDMTKQAKTARRQHRRAVLTHETAEKRSAMKLKLQITRIQRELDALRQRLEAWDPVEEAEQARKEAEQAEQERRRRAKEEEEEAQQSAAKKKKRYQRPGPETWQLKGAARPAHLVYDFDTRYECPHIKAHEQAAAKAKRSINILGLYKGKLGSGSANVPDAAREYLALLMELGYLHQDAGRYKSARVAWRECMELEGIHAAATADDVNDNAPITTARECLMRMYLQLGRDKDALHLGNELTLQHDTSVWIRYSVALVAARQEDDAALDHMRDAIRANPLCAFYVAFFETAFDSAMELTHELDGNDEEEEEEQQQQQQPPESSLEEAIDYCTSNGHERVQAWQACGADAQLRNLLLRAVQGQDEGGLTPQDVDWQDRLDKLQQAVEESQRQETKESDIDDANADNKESSKSSADDAPEADEDYGDGDELPVIDLSMYIKMYQTAMEMVEEEGFTVTSVSSSRHVATNYKKEAAS